MAGSRSTSPAWRRAGTLASTSVSVAAPMRPTDTSNMAASTAPRPTTAATARSIFSKGCSIMPEPAEPDLNESVHAAGPGLVELLAEANATWAARAAAADPTGERTPPRCRASSGPGFSTTGASTTCTEPALGRPWSSFTRYQVRPIRCRTAEERRRHDRPDPAKLRVPRVRGLHRPHQPGRRLAAGARRACPRRMRRAWGGCGRDVLHGRLRARHGRRRGGTRAGAGVPRRTPAAATRLTLTAPPADTAQRSNGRNQDHMVRHAGCVPRAPNPTPGGSATAGGPVAVAGVVVLVLIRVLVGLFVEVLVVLVEGVV